MNVIICLDEKNGFSFNNRRQSRDALLCKRMLEMTKGHKLWMSEYSAKLFAPDGVIADRDFLSKSGEGDYCFIESAADLAYIKRAETITVYRWNTVYPSDVKLEPDCLEDKKLISSVDFAGNSHDTITEEVYR